MLLKMKFQNFSSINMMNMNNMYNMMMMMIMMITSMIFYLMINIMNNKFNNKWIMEKQFMETLWTLMPMIIIIILMTKTTKILFMNNEMKMNILTIKILSNQWFWSYEYMNFKIKFNSFLKSKNKFDMFILETDNKMIIPFNYQIQLIISSLDVIHSWSIPSINIKIDSIPNHLNQMNLIINKPSILYGQCSEICGMNHSFMPISIESIKLMNLIKWMKNF